MLTWLSRTLDAWNLRILVLVSFALQLVLNMFGSHRKYISSAWVSVVIWVAYLMADSVATLSLGKLSDAEGKGKSNELWAIWAPLLLLHLGGPDNITAYSLEDNKLWMRHLMGLVVQMSVAIYVILMSSKNSWFSIMSLPAFIAGVAKYGERSWVLKSVSDEKHEDNIPIGDLGDKYPTGHNYYVHVLVTAHQHLKLFARYLHDQQFSVLEINSPQKKPTPEILWDVVEVKVGLMFDLLYTKASRIYRKQGCILRFISLVCTMTVLLGLIIQSAKFNLGKQEDKSDIVITWVLLVGALALEIYGVIVIFSSNWMMLWLIRKGRADWVARLSVSVPWLFYKGKNWCAAMGQFDAIDYWLKLQELDSQSQPKNYSQKSRGGRIMSVLRRKTRFVMGEKLVEMWNKSQHKTALPVRPLVYKVIFDVLGHDRINSPSSEDINKGVDKIWATLDEFRYFWGGGFKIKVMYLHIATKICYHSDTRPSTVDSEDSSSKDNMDVSKALSNYMMYLFAMQPSLLPNNGKTYNPAEKYIKDLTHVTHLKGASTVEAACKRLMEDKESPWYKVATTLQGEKKSKRWEIMKLIWVRMLQSAASSEEGFRHKDAHLQQLKQGGELLTFLWFYYNPRLIDDTTMTLDLPFKP